jgi:hypothetical protein
VKDSAGIAPGLVSKECYVSTKLSRQLQPGIYFYLCRYGDHRPASCYQRGWAEAVSDAADKKPDRAALPTPITGDFDEMCLPGGRA